MILSFFLLDEMITNYDSLAIIIIMGGLIPTVHKLIKQQSYG